MKFLQNTTLLFKKVLSRKFIQLRRPGGLLMFVSLVACHGIAIAQTIKPVDTSATKKPVDPAIYSDRSIAIYNFPGGTQGLDRYLRKNLKLRKGISGKILAEVTVEDGGKLTAVKIIKGSDWSLNQQIVDVLLFSPKWVNGSGKLRIPLTIDLADISR